MNFVFLSTLDEECLFCAEAGDGSISSDYWANEPVASVYYDPLARLIAKEEGVDVDELDVDGLDFVEQRRLYYAWQHRAA